VWFPAGFENLGGDWTRGERNCTGWCGWTRTGTYEPLGCVWFPIPCRCVGMFSGVHAGGMLRGGRPPSGGKLLMAPQGTTGFELLGTQLVVASFFVYIALGFPGEGVGRIGQRSLRRYMPIVLCKVGHSRWIFMDMCGGEHRDHDPCHLCLSTGGHTTADTRGSAVRAAARFCSSASDDCASWVRFA